MKTVYRTVILTNFFRFSDTKSSIIHHNNQQQQQQQQQQTQQQQQQQQSSQTSTPHTTHHHVDSSKNSPNERPYLGQTSLLPATNTSGIKSEPGYEYSCLQNQPYPYQQLFGFHGASSTTDVAYHHQHHVTAAAKLMASS